MRELVRLRDRLYAVVLATPLMACGGGRAHPAPAPVPDAGVETDPYYESDPYNQSGPLEVGTEWPAGYSSCSHAIWCGTTESAETHRQGDATTLDCPTYLTEPVEPGLVFGFHADETDTRRLAGDPTACCYEWANWCLGGRPYGAPVAAGATAAARWLAAAQTEHASVASFARASLELMAVGAPPALIAACHRAALDELRHASACLAIASRLAGHELALAPVPALAPRGGGVVRVAVDTYLEGCVAETHGALVALRALEGCTDEDASRALRWIAREEARHAELAWQIVAWAIEVGGAPVRAAIAHASERLGAPPSPRAADPALAGTGQLDDAGLDLAARDAWREIIAPLTGRILAG